MKFVYNTKLSGVIEAPIIPQISNFALKACALCREKSSIFGICLDDSTEETVSLIKKAGCKLTRKGLGISVLPPKNIPLAFKTIFAEEISRIGDLFKGQSRFIADNETDEDILAAALGFIVSGVSCDVGFIKQIQNKTFFLEAIKLLKTLGADVAFDGEKNVKIFADSDLGGNNIFVDGDWRVGAFGLTCGALGFDVGVSNVFSQASYQPESKIQEALSVMGVTFDETTNGIKKASGEGKKASKIDAQAFSELLPYLIFFATQISGETEVYNLTREIINMNEKAVFNTVSMLKQLGFEVTANRAGTIGIKGKKSFDGGIKINCRNDLTLSFVAILATLCSKKSNVLENCEVIDECFPTFWTDYSKIGGFAE